MKQRVITLLTDFGLADSYVGVMKGVMLRINPNLILVDITHSIPACDISRGAFRLFTAYKYFPSSTIHIAVVDPGVGTKRKPIIVETSDYYFVGPDNGIFSWIYKIYNKEGVKVYEIDITRVSEWPISNTFHGRDIFAPTAAKLSLGAKPVELGTPISKWIELKIPTPTITTDKIIGEVIDIDQFGNLITNITKSEFYSLFPSPPKFRLKIRNYIITELKSCYDAQAPIAIFGSSELLEISLPHGNCATFLNAKPGTKFTIQRA